MNLAIIDGVLGKGDGYRRGRVSSLAGSQDSNWRGDFLSVNKP